MNNAAQGRKDLQPGSPVKPSKHSIMVSAFVMPGAGQCMQKRWVAGIAYAVAIIIAVVGALIYAMKILKVYYGMLDIDRVDNGNASVTQYLPPMFTWFAVTLVVYAMNVFDTWLSYNRQLKKWLTAQRSLIQPPPIPTPHN